MDCIAGGWYYYCTTFILPDPVPPSFYITGEYVADDMGYMYLNGFDTGFDYGDWQLAEDPFELTATTPHLQAGLNTLEFEVDNASQTVTGLQVLITGAQVPEPSTLVLLAVGAISLVASAWWRRKRAA
jgi:hypothetical protein